MKNIFPSIIIFTAGCLSPHQASSQSNQWILGIWNGYHFSFNTRLTKVYFKTITVTAVNGNSFEGTAQTVLPSDTSVRIHYRIAGSIYQDHIMLTGKEVLHYKNRSDGKLFWILNCGCGDSTRYDLVTKPDSIFLVAKRNWCENKFCNFRAFVGKPLSSTVNNTSLATAGKDSLQFLPKDSMSMIKTTIAINDSVKPVSIFNGRMVNTITRYLVNADSVELRLSDSGVMDGDTVSLFLNGQLVVNKLALGAQPFILKVAIGKQHINQLILFADNLGSIPPNTAFVKILYNNKEEILRLSSDNIKSSSIELIFVPSSAAESKVPQ